MQPPQSRFPSFVVLSLLASACSTRDAKTDYTVRICIPAANWNQLEHVMRDFGRRHELEFHGAIERLSESNATAHLHDQLNYALIGGHHQFGDDDFDIWLVSNPEKPSDVYLNVISKHDLTLNHRKMAAEFERTITPIACKVAEDRP